MRDDETDAGLWIKGLTALIKLGLVLAKLINSPLPKMIAKLIRR